MRHLHKVTGDYVKEYQDNGHHGTSLPAEFAGPGALFGTGTWPTEPERYAKRLASTMAEMQEFYDAAFPVAERRHRLLDNYPLDDLPDDAKTLMHMMQSLVMVSFPIEVWKQPRVPDSGAA